MVNEIVESPYVARAQAFLDKGIRRYGLPASGPLYDGNLAALVDEHLHDFRLAELPGLVGDANFLTRRRTMLDLGCGPGTFVLRASLLGHDAVGIDLDAEKIELAQAWIGERALPPAWNDRVVVADGVDLPFPTEHFDVVSSYHVLEHVRDLPSVLYEAVRVTKRGGWLELRAPDYRMSFDTHYSMPWPRCMPEKQARRWANAMGRPADGVGTFFYVTANEVVGLLQALGCEVTTLALREHCDGVIRPFQGDVPVDPIIFRSDAEITEFAATLTQLAAQGRLPYMYRTCLEFTIVARRR